MALQTIDLRHGDCVEVMRTFGEGSIDSIVCDPPYGLEFMGNSWDSPKEMMSGQLVLEGVRHGSSGSEKVGKRNGSAGPYAYGGTHSRGYAATDNGLLRQWNANWLQEALRVLQPGGIIKAFSGTRTLHCLAGAMEDVGFQNISLEAWAYGSGFPKSLNIGKALDAPASQKWEGWGTALKPAWEPVVVGYKP